MLLDVVGYTPLFVGRCWTLILFIYVKEILPFQQIDPSSNTFFASPTPLRSDNHRVKPFVGLLDEFFQHVGTVQKKNKIGKAPNFNIFKLF